jgi:hypothetical protein
MKYLVTALLLLCSVSLEASEDLDKCAAIAGAAERLACYDRIARHGHAADDEDAGQAATPAPSPPAAIPPEPKPEHRPKHIAPEVAPATEAQPERQKPAVAAHSDEETTIAIPERPAGTGEPPGNTQFGKRGSHVTRGDSISSFIKSARINNARLYVISLANGQVWMQREPGRRHIRSNQPAVITRKRFSYSMYLEDQHFDVTVQRID